MRKLKDKIKQPKIFMDIKQPELWRFDREWKIQEVERESGK
jgi:hypothetical protein